MSEGPGGRHIAPAPLDRNPKGNDQVTTLAHQREAARERQRRHRNGETAPRARVVYLKLGAPGPAVINPACWGEEPELWFSDDPADQAKAVSICAGCPARQACHELADANGERFGIWAGVDRSAKRLASAS